MATTAGQDKPSGQKVRSLLDPIADNQDNHNTPHDTARDIPDRHDNQNVPAPRYVIGQTTYATNGSHASPAQPRLAHDIGNLPESSTTSSSSPTTSYHDADAHYVPSNDRGVVAQETNSRTTVTTDRVAREPGLLEKATAVVDAQTQGVRARINEKTQELTAELDQRTKGLQKELNPDSHDLARNSPAVSGAVTQQRMATGIDGGVVDIGWHRDTSSIPDPLIYGYRNGDVFSYIRRFNKDVFDVRSVPMEVARGLDLNESWAPDYTTDKIPLALQRLYLTFGLGVASLIRHVSRLRSWNEFNRTAAFCGVYIVAWLVDMLVPVTIAVLIAVVGSPKARDILFPPAPLALVDISTGALKEPASKQLGTSNTLTGAPEKHDGEAVQQEAANFADNIRHLVTRSVGMHNEHDEGGDPLEGKVPAPIRKGIRKVQAEGQAAGHVDKPQDPVQQPMEDMMWEKVKPEKLDPVLKMVPHVLGELADNYERFANAINPSPPFSEFAYLRIVAVLAPMLFMSLFVNYYMVYKGIGAGIGFALFGDPILTPAYQWLNRNYPNWPELVEPKNNILRGVPTNNQIALTLLRIGEAYKTPLPPVPKSKEDEPYKQQHIDVDDIPLEGSRAEKTYAISPNTMPPQTSDEDDDGPKHKHMSKLIRIFKGQTKAAVETKLAVDHVRAAAGSEKAKGHLGVLPKEKNLVYAGPSEFKARYQGKPGWLYITETADPVLVFTKQDPRPDGAKTMDKPELSIPIKEIKRLKRATAFAMKPAEMAADYSEDKELLGSVEISTADTNQANDVYRFTAIPERDELFNRLVAIGNQRWQNM